MMQRFLGIILDNELARLFHGATLFQEIVGDLIHIVAIFWIFDSDESSLTILGLHSFVFDFIEFYDFAF